MKENIFKGILTAAMAAVGLYFRELAVPVGVLLGVMVMDYITGMADAWSAGELSSKVGLRGIVKKLCYLIAVAVAVVVDWIIQTAAGKAGMELGSFYAFGLLVTIWLILNECISILENLDKLGVPLPGFLRKIIEKLRMETEKGAPTESEISWGEEEPNQRLSTTNGSARLSGSSDDERTETEKEGGEDD